MTWASLFSDVPHWKNSMGRLTPVWLRPRLTLQSHSTRARLTVLASDTKGHRPDSFIRVHLARANAIGPGKADLLEVIAETASIAASPAGSRNWPASCPSLYWPACSSESALRSPW